MAEHRLLTSIFSLINTLVVPKRSRGYCSVIDKYVESLNDLFDGKKLCRLLKCDPGHKSSEAAKDSIINVLRGLPNLDSDVAYLQLQHEFNEWHLNCDKFLSFIVLIIHTADQFKFTKNDKQKVSQELDVIRPLFKNSFINCVIIVHKIKNKTLFDLKANANTAHSVNKDINEGMTEQTNETVVTDVGTDPIERVINHSEESDSEVSESDSEAVSESVSESDSEVSEWDSEPISESDSESDFEVSESEVSNTQTIISKTNHNSVTEDTNEGTLESESRTQVTKVNAIETVSSHSSDSLHINAEKSRAIVETFTENTNDINKKINQNSEIREQIIVKEEPKESEIVTLDSDSGDSDNQYQVIPVNSETNLTLTPPTTPQSADEGISASNSQGFKRRRFQLCNDSSESETIDLLMETPIKRRFITSNAQSVSLNKSYCEEQCNCKLNFIVKTQQKMIEMQQKLLENMTRNYETLESKNKALEMDNKQLQQNLGINFDDIVNTLQIEDLSHNNQIGF